MYSPYGFSERLFIIQTSCLLNTELSESALDQLIKVNSELQQNANFYQIIYQYIIFGVDMFLSNLKLWKHAEFDFNDDFFYKINKFNVTFEKKSLNKIDQKKHARCCILLWF